MTDVQRALVATEFWRALTEEMPSVLTDADSPILIAMTQHRQYVVTGVSSNEDGDIIILLEFVT